MTKVCVYTIAKNEEKFVDRFMDSVQSADYVVVLDTGSADNTVERLRQRGAIVEQQIVKPWRFDVARNKSIDICPLDTDIFLSVDLDEIIVEADWKERILSSWGNHNRGRYHYVWDHRNDGTDGVSFLYEKMHTRDYEWFLPCHEILRRTIPGEDSWADVDITVKHYPDPVKSRGNYLDLLKLATTEYPDNDRVAHYYGRELFFRCDWLDAIKELERHVNLKTSTWADERCASMTMIGHCYKALNNNEQAERWYLRACGEAPHLREPFVDAAKFYNEGHRYPMAYAFAKRALQIEHKPASYLATPYAWNEGPHDLVAVSAYYIGLKPESLANARIATEKAPWDPRLKENLEIITRMSPELMKSPEMPKIIRHEPWIDDPKFGLVIGTYGSIPYVHLALAVKDKLYKDVPTIVIDDNSPQRDQLRILASQYGVEFFSHAKSFNHTRGDVMAMVTGMRWATDKQLDVIVKMSRRFIPKVDWRPSLTVLIQETVHATYVGTLDGTWGLRTECIGFHVKKWLPQLKSLIDAVNNSDWLWVEKLIQDHAVKIISWGTGNLAGAAMWDFVGLGKWVKTDTHLWHDTSNPSDYHYLSTQFGLPYNIDDFNVLASQFS